MVSKDSEETSERPAKRARESDSPKRRDGAPRKKGRVPPDEPTPVISGRFLTASVLVLGLTVIPMSSVGQWIEPKDPTVPKPNTWQVGA